MRSFIVFCCVLILLSGIIQAQDSIASCPLQDGLTGQPEDGPLRSHRVYMGLAENGVADVDKRNAGLIIDEASVPEGFVGPDGRLWVYYINGAAGSPHRIHVSTQQDDGSWQLLDCVLLDDSINGNAVDPDVVRLADGRYRLFYFEGNFVGPRPPGPPSENEMHPIYSAISEDGINFTVEGVAFEYPTITDPTVVQAPDSTWLLAAAYSGQVAIARSDDGLVFTALEPVDDDGIPELSLDGEGNVLLWGSSQWVTSDNGMTWTKTDHRSLGPDPSIVWLDDGSIAFFYKDFNPELMPPPGKPGQPPNKPPDGELPPCPPITENVTPIPCNPKAPENKQD